MTRDEFKILVKGMKAVYTAPSFIPDKDAFEIWYGLLNDLPYDVANAAIQSYMMTETKLPVPADIRKKSQMFTNTTELNELEAWSLVSKALSNGCYGADEEFSKLPPLVQKAVGSPANIREWAQLDFKALSVIQSNFVRVYGAVAKREDEISRMPSQIRQMIQEREVPKIKIENNSKKNTLEDEFKDTTEIPEKEWEKLQKILRRTNC